MRTLLAAPLLRPSVATWRLPALFTLLAIATLSVGIVALLHQQRSESHDALYSLTAALLLLTAIVQASLAWRQTPWARRRMQSARRSSWPEDRRSNCPAVPLRTFAVRLALRLVTSLVFCYLVAMSTGAGPTAPFVFAAAAMACLTLILLPFTAPSETIDRWRRILHGRGPRRFARLLQVTLLVGVVGELSLRAGEWLWESTLRDVPEPLQANLARVVKPGESVVPPSGEYGLATGSGSTSGHSLRVAMVGDELVLAAASPQGAFARLEAALPSIKCFNFSAPQAGPREYAGQGIQQVRRLRPDLVLTFVSIADDIVGESQRPSLFDWRSLCIPRLLLRGAGLPTEKAGSLSVDQTSGSLGPLQRQVGQPADDWDAYVAACGPQLNVCRRPINPSMQQRWKITLRYLDDLAETCRRENIPLALVIVPSPLQTNRPLLDAVCRREGCGLTDVDVELPQRRLAAYAADRKVPAFDLLPALRLCPEQPYVHQGWHWNDAGNETAARALTGWLQSTFTFSATLAARQPDRLPVTSATAASRLVAHRQ